MKERKAPRVCVPWLAVLLCAAIHVRASDCNGNGRSDLEETRAGLAPDCNENGVPDACDVLPVNFGFARGPTIPADVPISELALGDIDGDGDQDMVALGHEGFQALPGDGSGSFSEGSPIYSQERWSRFSLADLDSDGAQEVLARTVNVSPIVVYTFGGADAGSVFAPAAFLDVQGGLDNVAAADLDADGDLDVLAGMHSGFDVRQVVAFVNQGDFVFERAVLPGISRFLLGAFDEDSDGRADLVLNDSSGQREQVAILRNEAPGTFSPLAVDPVGGYSMLEGDFDADGDLDLVVASASRVRILLNHRESSSFRLAGSLNVKDELLELLAADLDGDLDLDLAGLEGEDIVVFLNSGLGSFEERLVVGQRERTAEDRSLIAGRFDADMDIDLAVGKNSYPVGRVLVLENRPTPLGLDCDRDGVPDECVPGAPAACADCDRNGIPDSHDLEEGDLDRNENAVLDRCETEIDFRFRFRAPLALSGSPGTPLRVPASVELETLGLARGEAGVRGWSVRVAADGGKLVSATTEGTLAGPPPLGLFSGGLSMVDFPLQGSCDGGTLVSAVVLSLHEPIALPQTASEVLRFEVETAPPDGGGQCRLRFQRLCNPRPVTVEGAGADSTLQILVNWNGQVANASVENHTIRLVVPPGFVRGDANSDGKVDISDAIRGFMFLFLGASAPLCLDTFDANDDGGIDITDGIHILNDFFREGTGIPAPGPFECGMDPTPDRLSCREYPHCA